MVELARDRARRGESDESRRSWAALDFFQRLQLIVREATLGAEEQLTLPLAGGLLRDAAGVLRAQADKVESLAAGSARVQDEAAARRAVVAFRDAFRRFQLAARTFREFVSRDSEIDPQRRPSADHLSAARADFAAAQAEAEMAFFAVPRDARIILLPPPWTNELGTIAS
jgi:hypothetical protein